MSRAPARPLGTSLAAAYAARMLGSGKGCPKRPAPPTEAAGSHYTDCRVPASYDLSFSLLIILKHLSFAML